MQDKFCGCPPPWHCPRRVQDPGEGVFGAGRRLWWSSEQPVLFSHPCCSSNTIKEVILCSRIALSSQGQILLIGNPPREQSCNLFCLPVFPTAENSSSAQIYPTQSTASHPGMIPWKTAEHHHLLAVALKTSLFCFIQLVKPSCSALFSEVLFVLHLSIRNLFFLTGTQMPVRENYSVGLWGMPHMASQSTPTGSLCPDVSAALRIWEGSSL